VTAPGARGAGTARYDRASDARTSTQRCTEMEDQFSGFRDVRTAPVTLMYL